MKGLKKLLLLCALSPAALAVQAHNNDDVLDTDTLRTKRLDEITIYASKTDATMRDLPNKVEVINERQIELSGASNLTDLLKSITNVDVVQYPGYNSYFSIRGYKPTESKYTIVLIDGVPAGTGNISTLSLGDIEQVEMLKGPFSALYGSDAMGGVVNIVTKKNKGALTGSIKGSMGSNQSAKGALNLGGHIWKGLSFDASADYAMSSRNYKTGNHNMLHMSKIDKAIVGEDTYGVRMPGSRSNGFSGKFRLGYDFNRNWSLDFTQMEFLGKDLPIGGNIWSAYGVRKKDITRHSSKLELKGRVKNHNLFLAPYYSEYRTETYNADSDDAFVQTDSKLKTVGFVLNDNITFGKQSIAIGIDNKNELNKMNRFKKKDEPMAPYKPDYNNSSLGMYVQSNLKFFEDKLNVSLGGRYDHIMFKLKESAILNNAGKSESYNTFNPNLGLKYFILPELAFHSSYGTAFSMPNAYQKAGEFIANGTLTIGNPDLKPEKAQTIDVGFSFNHVESGIDLDLTYFYTWNKDFIIEESFKDETGQKCKTFKNADKAKKSGLEVLASYNFGALYDYKFSLKLYGNLTWMFDFKDKSKDVWTETISVRKQNASFGLDFLAQNGFSARLNGRFMGSRFEKNFVGEDFRPTLADLWTEYQGQYKEKGLLKHPKFIVWDFTMAYPVVDKVTIGFNINNILDENYTEKDGYNMPGRTFSLKASYHF